MPIIRAKATTTPLHPPLLQYFEPPAGSVSGCAPVDVPGMNFLDGTQERGVPTHLGGCPVCLSVCLSVCLVFFLLLNYLA